MITYTQKLNMSAGGKPSDIYLSQRDTNVQLIFHLYATDCEFALENGTTVSGGGTRSDGVKVTFSGSLSIVNRTVTIQVPAAMTAVAGIGKYEIVLTHAGKELHSSNFKVHVEAAA